ncbi:lipid II flippase Amj family protein [Oceanobacillus luteolus]|uniref:lipid II flippase Amj family protein n=1 Tax=Oceanobacillus luteolus TaxID=1274358 RepID=UPI00204087FC|nr:lipid II flippase Amj family protein [Oceanobacillus luteolus]MCM3742169.1 lipid II flippase Amj family protein [Oceanobacillus luteolus]
MEFITEKLIFIALFIFIIHSIETLAYAVRLSGARVKMIASALSLFNVMVIVSRLANMMHQPVTGNLVDTAPESNALEFVEAQYRFLIGASTVGTIFGILLLPTFVALFSRAIIHLSEEKGSVPSLFKRIFSLHYIKRGLTHFSLPKFSYLRNTKIKDIPIRLFFVNMIITAIYTIGVLSALYAALLVPERELTATMASGLINGLATILLVIFVDPKVSVIADDVVNDRGSYLSLKSISIMMVLSRLCGTILAQLLFIPGAKYIAWFTTFF